MFPISYRDLELMLLDRGVEVDHMTIFRWIQAYFDKVTLTETFFLEFDADGCSHRVRNRHGAIAVQPPNGMLDHWDYRPSFLL